MSRGRWALARLQYLSLLEKKDPPYTSKEAFLVMYIAY